MKGNRVVAFVKGTRTAPQCGFSHKVLTMLAEVAGQVRGGGLVKGRRRGRPSEAGPRRGARCAVHRLMSRAPRRCPCTSGV